MNATTITNIIEPTQTTIKVKKQRGPYGPRKPKALVIVKEDSDSEHEEEPEPVASPIPEPTDFTLTEEDLVEGARLVAEQEAEDDDDAKSSISSIAEESEAEEEAEPEAEPEAEEDNPVVLRSEFLDLKNEVIRLTSLIQDLQNRLVEEEKQPKKQPKKKEAKEKKEGKRTNTRARRPKDYAEQYLEKGQVLRWEHKTRQVWGEATYIGDNKFIGKFSFVPEGEYPEEFPSLNALAEVMLKQMTLRTINAWSAFKNIDGTSVENLDLQAKA